MWLGDSSVKLQSLGSGSVQLAYLRDPATVDKAMRRYPGLMTVVSLGQVLWINNRKGHPGADLRVRQAISYALDPQVVARARAIIEEDLPMAGHLAEWAFLADRTNTNAQECFVDVFERRAAAESSLMAQVNFRTSRWWVERPRERVH